jgi:hypothetical protein
MPFTVLGGERPGARTQNAALLWRTFARMRSEVPPPGRAMSFPEWSEAIVAGVRAYLPDARAVRKGARTVIIRHGGCEAHLVDDGGAFVISFRGNSATSMSSLVDRDRRDEFTVSNLAHSVAGFFDSNFTRAENS